MGTTEEGLTGERQRDRVRAWLDRLGIEQRNTLAEIDLSAGTVLIPCSGAIHRARIDGGRFVLDDHDVDAELAMAVFGAALPECLMYQGAWDGARHDTFLAEWAADGDGDRLDHARDDWYGNYWESWPREPSAARVLFGPNLQRELAIATTELWPLIGGREGPGALWASVRHAITTRARRAVVLSLAAVDAHRRPDALVPISITVAPAGDATFRGILSRRASYVELRLPVAWLAQVWARDLALLDDRFVLAVDDGEATATVVRWRPTGRSQREHEPVLEQMPLPVANTGKKSA